MLFNSLNYLIFLPAIFLVYYVIPHKWRWTLLLAGSYFFYMNWNASYALLMLFVTLSSYVGALLIDLFRNNEQYKNLTKGTLFASLGTIISLLLYFKYANFLAASLHSLSASWNGDQPFDALDILLPVGISFFTFQSMGYVIDVYRQETKPEKHLGIYALYVSFFPQLVAGPIERSFNLINQFKEKRSFNYDQAKKGALQILWGFYLKLVIADRLAVVVNYVYNDPSNHEGWILIVATLFFSFQIFCDFAGYSYIAIGSAKLLGIDLMKNFDNPYFSTSIGEFWRRWHISLSTWFKDYLFIPLGGSRGSQWLTYRNILIVFVVSGLWHGANWTFVIWGALHGLFWVIENGWKALKAYVNEKLNISIGSTKTFGWVTTYLLVCFAWIFFRANSLNDAWYVITNLQYLDPQHLFSGYLYKLGLSEREFNIGLLSLFCLLLIQFFHARFNLYEWLSKQWLPVRWCAYLLLVFIILLYGYFNIDGATPEFIYFQF